ncbi:oligosaccharide flippase family protein [Salinibacter ruber]|uniref:oligosaccharide flippase family protein n=1 Tax=Salinibacter ruber TaxID=146919 RepID=UPI0021689338|nr:oligosaccharide flippase family protein [Salinibacter ruber]MCS4142425.1 O-antigen/teichoic acid export membrane protein [Salinibacter ruber]
MFSSEQKTIIKSSGIGFGGKFIKKSIGYVWVVIVAREIGPDGLGRFVIANSIVSISLIFVLIGIPSTLDKYIPKYKNEKKSGKIKTLIWTTFIITLSLSVIVTTGLWQISGYISKITESKNIEELIRILVLVIPSIAVIKYVCGAYVGYSNIAREVLVNRIITPSFKLFGAILLVIIQGGVITWAYIYAVSMSIAAMISLCILMNDVVKPLVSVRARSLSLRRVLSYAWPLSANKLIMRLLSRSDYLIAGLYIGGSPIGVYKVYTHLASVMAVVLGPFAKIYKPVGSGELSDKGVEKVGELYTVTTRWIVILSSFIFAFIILYGADVITIFFTEEYVVSISALYILLLGYLLNSYAGPEGKTLEVFGNTRLSLVNALIMLGVNITLNFVLIPSLGIIGAAIATATSIALGAAVGLLEIYSLYKIHPVRLFHLKSIFGLFVTLIAGVIFDALFESKYEIFDLLFKGFTSLTVYVGTVWIVDAVNKRDLALLKSIIKA